MSPKLFVATKAIIKHKGKVLILREAGSYADGTQIGKYGVPGGRLEPGERFDEALAREVFEETGLTVELGKPLAVDEWRPNVRGEEWQIVGIFFECKALTTDIRLSSEHDTYEWIDPSEQENYSLIENERIIIKNLISAE